MLSDKQKENIITTTTFIADHCSEQTHCEDCIFGDENEIDDHGNTCHLSGHAPTEWSIGLLDQKWDAEDNENKKIKYMQNQIKELVIRVEDLQEVIERRNK